MRRLAAGLMAAGILVAGGLAYVVAVGVHDAAAQDEETTITTTTDPGDDLTQDEGADHPIRPVPAGEILSGALEELVADGTITEEQADAIVAALQTHIDERRAELEAWRNDLPRPGIGGWFGLGSEVWDDGVLDADELAALPDDHPWLADDGPLAEALADGEITTAEMRDAFDPTGLRGGPFGGGPLRGPFGGPEHPAEDGDTDAEGSSLRF